MTIGGGCIEFVFLHIRPNEVDDWGQQSCLRTTNLLIAHTHHALHLLLVLMARNDIIVRKHEVWKRDVPVDRSHDAATNIMAGRKCQP